MCIVFVCCNFWQRSVQDGISKNIRNSAKALRRGWILCVRTISVSIQKGQVGLSETLQELISRHVRLIESAAERPDGHGGMTGDHTAGISSAQNHMASPLPYLTESEAFQSANGFVSGNLPELRQPWPRT